MGSSREIILTSDLRSLLAATATSIFLLEGPTKFSWYWEKTHSRSTFSLKILWRQYAKTKRVLKHNESTFNLDHWQALRSFRNKQHFCGPFLNIVKQDKYLAKSCCHLNYLSGLWSGPWSWFWTDCGNYDPRSAEIIIQLLFWSAAAWWAWADIMNITINTRYLKWLQHAMEERQAANYRIMMHITSLTCHGLNKHTVRVLLPPMNRPYN